MDIFNNDGEKESSTSLLSPLKKDSSTPGGALTKMIGGKMYSINPYQIKLRRIPNSFVAKMLSWVYSIVTAPFLAVGFFGIYSTCMLLGTESMRQFIISKILPGRMGKIAELLKHERHTLLQHVSGNVMDVGSGAGSYFIHFLNARRLVAIEPLEILHPILARQAQTVGLDMTKVTITTELLEDYLANHFEECESFDWIILGNVLCEVHCLSSTVRVIDKLLKPGGSIFFCEHIAKPKGSLMRRVQDFINPWWTRISMGCNCNRESLDILQSVPNWEVIAWEIPVTSMPWIAPFVMGLVRKKNNPAIEP
mmetsp:Transcript_11608/g.16686  ORF Transcript_11608/g.16686 Transcript_11608/m.16686 type:complete len:309 (-) Transcript_11608:88-1014(-)